MKLAAKGTVRRDLALDQILDALRAYAKDHPGAAVEAYRQDRFSVCVRVVEPALSDLGRLDRYEQLWSYLGGLAENVVSQVVSTTLVTPSELKTSGSSLDFDDHKPKPAKKPKARRAS